MQRDMHPLALSICVAATLGRTSDARSAAEMRMVEHLSKQIDECLDLADYDWAPQQPRSAVG